MTGRITVREWDEVIVSGRSYSCCVDGQPYHDFVDFAGTVATVDPGGRGEEGYLSVPAIRVTRARGE